MKPKRDLEDHWRDLCASLGEDDGVPPEEDKRHNATQRTDRGNDRSTRRLCAHAMRMIRLSLLADCHDTDLQALDVGSVKPYPDAKRLLVTLVSIQDCNDLNRLQSKVQAVSHLLRYAVARSMSRKRTPQLSFVVVPQLEVDDEE